MWLQSLMNELKLWSENSMLLYCNNKLAISVVHNPTHHGWTKDIEVDWHFIKKLISMSYIASNRQLVDFLTKGLSQVNFDGLITKFTIINIYKPT